MKKYLKEVMHRDGGVHAPWMVRKRYAREFGVPFELPHQSRTSTSTSSHDTGTTKRKQVSLPMLPARRLHVEA